MDKRKYWSIGAIEKKRDRGLREVSVTKTGSSFGYERRVIFISPVRTYSDRSMGAYYYCDLTSGQVQKLADVSPWLDEEKMSSMQPVQFQSRDGLTLHGSLTLPKGVNAKSMK